MGNSDSADQSLTTALEEVRRFVVSRLKAGDRPDELSFALAFVAADMGLRVTKGKEPLGVYSTVLRALAAAANGSSGGDGNGASPKRAADLDDQVPAGAIIH